MPVIVVFHYLTAFALELALLFGFGLFGYRFGQGGVAGMLLAVLLVGVAIALWGRFAAPRSATRLPERPLLAFKIVIFLAGTLAFWLAGWREPAPIFGMLAAFDLGLAMALGRI